MQLGQFVVMKQQVRIVPSLHPSIRGQPHPCLSSGFPRIRDRSFVLHTIALLVAFRARGAAPHQLHDDIADSLTEGHTNRAAASSEATAPPIKAWAEVSQAPEHEGCGPVSLCAFV